MLTLIFSKTGRAVGILYSSCSTQVQPIALFARSVLNWYLSRGHYKEDQTITNQTFHMVVWVLMLFPDASCIRTSFEYLNI